MAERRAIRPRPTEVDLGVCHGEVFDTGADRWVILLPGANYPPSAPLLWFAREAALARGWNTLGVWDTFGGGADPLRWVEERGKAAIRHVEGATELSVVAKSITTLAAPLAARLGLPAVWLTPLIDPTGTSVSRLVMDGLAEASAPCLLIGGSADPTWDAALARSIPMAEVLEISDADHVMQIPGDVSRSLHALGTVARAMTSFIDAVSSGRVGAGGESAVRLTGIDHVQLAIPPDREASAREFFGSLLGLREVEKPRSLAQRGGCWFVGLGIHLHLGVDPDFRPARKAHPAFTVSDTEALRQRLHAAGVPITDDDAAFGVRRFYALDPFGNRLEFIEHADRGFTDDGERA